MRRGDDVERFWRLVDRSNSDGCWPWLGTRGSKGYGFFTVNGSPTGAHRWILGALRGDALTAHEVARHTCDNPPCCRPDHLLVGTHSDNMLDSVARGRHRQTRKTHCAHGHEFTPENTYVSRDGHRRCSACTKDHARRNQATRTAYMREYRKRQS